MGFDHQTVLREPAAAAVAAGALRALAVAGQGAVIDATLGGGGHSERLLELLADAPQLRVIGIDRDPAALAAATSRLARFGGRFTAVHGRFAEFTQHLGSLPLLGLVADLGVSSPQFDNAERGFSFRGEGPIDMRMDPSQGPTAAELLAEVKLEELADILYEYGDIRHSIGTARAVLYAVQHGADTTTKLADYLAKRLPRDRSLHPATQVFQALRMWVNGEMQQIDTLLATAPGLLTEGAAMAVISFHSGEDRAVKQAFAELARGGEFHLPERRGVVAQPDEIAANPRARSARLRVLVRGAASPKMRSRKFLSEEADGEETNANDSD